ncbi:MAG: DNA polymerase III subunit alpha [Spirochaetaceae bacterium]|jgi:DNA polymerase-3 subunit alpha|nr:DNA polymerase III subunit alpha [Spirochaetaceae bacterium]
MTDFVHLHVHTDFSLLDGAASVESLAKKASDLGMKHLAITDHGNMFGVLKFKEACEKYGIHPIIGSEFYMTLGSRHQKAGSETGNKYYHLILLAKNGPGYRNLIKLSSYSYTEGFYYKPRIDEELLIKYRDGLICLSACVGGEIPSLILDGQMDAAEKRSLWFRDLFGGENFYLELQDHRLPIQEKANPGILEIAKRTGIPLVVTNDIHYLEKEDAVAQDILLCISTQKRRNDEKRMRFGSSEFYFKTGDEMAALFPDYPEAVSNTIRIAEQCKTEIPKPGPLLPDFDIPEGFSNTDEYIRHITLEGLKKRYPDRFDEVRERAEYELEIIIKMGFTGYFLIVADFINWAKEHDIPVGPGRGSGAGSIVAYAIRITDIDPLKYNLLFERFLNPERVSMPDFDVDFCNERREEVINYVTKKYGQNRVGQIVTFGTLKAKAVLKDVARALEFSIDESNMITKLVPEDPKMTLEKAFEIEPKLKELEAKDERHKELFAIARKLEGKNRHNSIHAAGIVIGKTDLTDYVPLCWDPKTQASASQYTMDLIEDQGLVKMDFLGLKTLDLIKNTVTLVRRRGGKFGDFTIDAISEQDESAFKMLGKGNSAGIFQFESTGMQKILKQAKPTRIEDLIALNALYRPGPMDYIPQFIDSKWGRQAVEYPDPCLEEILKETYGVIVYQEQVMQVAQKIAGYSLGQADILRRAMGKKKKEVMIKEKEKFIAGAEQRGFKTKDADRIFEILIPFAGYGFNKSHAAAYSVVAYQTAYLKANFPAEFMAANLTNEIDHADKLPDYIEEARKMDLAIDPPDINRSDVVFSVSEGRIVYGFLGIKGLGEASAEEIVAKRQDGLYKNFMDFLSRVNIKTIGKKTVELLIQTGAFDRFETNRATLAENMDRAIEYAQSKKAEKLSGQTGLFEETAEQEFSRFELKKVAEWDRMEKLRIEKELMGFYFSGHPLDDYRAAWDYNVTLNLDKITKSLDGTHTLIGVVKSIKPFLTKKGTQMAFASLSDYNGEIELTFFPEVWEKERDKFEADQVIALRGKADRRENRDRPSFLVETLLDVRKLQEDAEKRGPRKRPEPPAEKALPAQSKPRAAADQPQRAPEPGNPERRGPPPPRESPEKIFREVHIRLTEHAAEQDETLYPLRELLTRTSGSCSVFIHVPCAGNETVIKTDQLRASGDAIPSLARCEGVANAWTE